MADNVGDLTAAFAKAAIAVGAAQTAAIGRAALTSKRTIEGTRDRATGGDGRLSGVGKRGAKLGVRYDLKDGPRPSAVVRATGPWQLIERDTKSAGVIRPRRNRQGRRRRSSGPQALASGGFGPFSKIVDKGTTGKHPFEKGAKKAAPQATKQMRATVTKAVARSF